MSAFKGTPGPWEIESRTTSTPGVDVAWSIRNSEWHTIAGGQSQEHLGESGIHALECSANARLIASAPDLLGLHKADLTDLDLLAMAIHAGDPMPELVIRVTDMLNRKLAAIARATGADQ